MAQLKSSRARTRGDGMESLPSTYKETPLSAEEQTLKRIVGRQSRGVPLADILGQAAPKCLREGPPAFSLTPIVVNRPAGGQLSKTAALSQSREPRFVPYEPYPGCVSAISRPPAASSVPPSTVVSARSKPSSAAGTSAAAAAPTDPNEVRDLREQVRRLSADKQRLQQQLLLADQVTEDLKRLMVASMGEDIETRLSLMTEDKARLANLVRSFSVTVAEQDEDQDQLTIQCDVWRSKFMACSLMVDEMANWKTALIQRNKDSEQIIRALLQERCVVHRNLVTAHSVVASLACTLDPGTAPGDTSCSDVVSCSEAVRGLLELLLQRLSAAGGQDIPPPVAAAGGVSLPPTQTEVKAYRLLVNRLCFQWSAGLDTGRDRGMQDRFHPRTRLEHLTINCCSHCSGEVQVV